MATGRTYYFFLDESGDHSLSVIDPQYPVFVLGGALFLAEEYERASRRWVALKRELFGSEDVIIHTADLTRNRNGFERMKQPAFRHRVHEALNQAVAASRFTAFGCAVRKDLYLANHGLGALDPYHLSLGVLIDKALMSVGRGDNLHIVAESRNPWLDRMLDVVFLELKIRGTLHFPPVEFNARKIHLSIRDKSDNILGLQFADLLVSPMGRYVLGKTAHADWGVIEDKLHRHKGTWKGEGLVILPG